MNKYSRRQKTSVACAYFFGVPALYLILTVNRDNREMRQEAQAALMMWVKFFLVFWALRFLIDLIWLAYYLPALIWLEICAVWLMAAYALVQGSRLLRS